MSELVAAHRRADIFVDVSHCFWLHQLSIRVGYPMFAEK